MVKRINYQLTDEQIQQVEWAIAHDPCPEVVRRATAIRLLHQGHKPEAVASMVSASVQNWHQCWRTGGWDGLANVPIPGRRPKADATYQQMVETALDSDPHPLGYAFSVWTVERLTAHMERQTGVRLSMVRLGIWLRRWGYGYRQPKTDLAHKQAPAVREQVHEWLDELKKQPSIGLAAAPFWTKQP